MELEHTRNIYKLKFSILDYTVWVKIEKMVKINQNLRYVLLGIAFIFLIGLAFAEIWWTGIFGSPYPMYSVNENTAYTYNLTINNTFPSNITQLNITLPGVFSYVNITNVTNCTGSSAVQAMNFTVYSQNLISWWNFTYGIVNDTASMNCSFKFNATTTLSALYPPGNYTITVAAQYTNGTIITTNLYTQVNDTTLPAVSWDINTPGNYSNLSSSSIYVLVNITELFPKNITFRLYFFNHSLYNITTYSLSDTTHNTSINWTDLYKDFFNGSVTNTTVGNRTSWLFNVTVCDTSHNCGNTSYPITKNISINDSLPPQVTINRPVAYGNYSGNLNISVTIFDHFIINKSVNFTIFNAYGKMNASYNATNYTTNAWVYNFNTASTTFPDGRYNLTVNTKDYGKNGSGNINNSEMIYFTIDNTAPTVSLSLKSSSSNTIVITATVHDSLSGIESLCSVSRTGATISASSVVTGEKTEQTITETGLSCGTAYKYTVTCSDRAGNSVSSGETSYSTDSCGGGSSGGGGGGGTTPSTWTATYMPTDAEVTAGYTKDLATNNRVSLKVGTETHYVGVTSVTSTTASIQVASTTPIEVKLTIGQDAKVDVNNDGFYEVYVKLNSISNNKANVLIKTIHEEVPVGSTGTVSTTGQEVTPTDVNEPAVPETKTSSSALWWIIGIVVIIIVAILIILIVKKKK